MSELEEMTLNELKEIAKEQNIKNISKLKKDELIEVLIDLQRSRNKAEETEKRRKQITNEKKQDYIKYDSSDEENEFSSESMNGDTVVDYKLTNEEDEIIEGILEVLPDGYGFLRGDNYLSSPRDVYISPIQIRRFRLDTGDMVKGISRCKEGEKFPSLIFVGEVNGEIEEGTKEVTYIYDLTPLPPHTGTNKSNSINYVKYCLYFMLVIGLVKLFKKKTIIK